MNLQTIIEQVENYHNSLGDTLQSLVSSLVELHKYESSQESQIHDLQEKVKAQQKLINSLKAINTSKIPSKQGITKKIEFNDQKTQKIVTPIEILNDDASKKNIFTEATLEELKKKEISIEIKPEEASKRINIIKTPSEDVFKRKIPTESQAKLVKNQKTMDFFTINALKNTNRDLQDKSVKIRNPKNNKNKQTANVKSALIIDCEGYKLLDGKKSILSNSSLLKNLQKNLQYIPSNISDRAEIL
ncbi:hypothetical protein SteCoe_18414 [Stentor coeruleus]|uniref:Uncharacterized protein n=1 Tax=Stentor coeruleus TaxID=5963 RepID=A0A1R2BWL6_9CILI|nr:hypothetical protein SteCoe_18414 [Stentor coeruleus]